MQKEISKTKDKSNYDINEEDCELSKICSEKQTKKQTFQMFYMNNLQNHSTASSIEGKEINLKSDFSNQCPIKKISSFKQMNEKGFLENEQKPFEEEQQKQQEEKNANRSTSQFLQKLQSKKFFLLGCSNKKNIRIQYYLHYLLHQTIKSPEVRIHAKNNFNELQYLKQQVLPKLDEFPLLDLNIPKRSNKKEWKTLLLDLDETLIHCIDDSTDDDQCQNSIHEIIMNEESPFKIQVSLRPGLQNFLKTVSGLFEVIVFTASEKNYATKVVEIIDQMGFIDGVIDRQGCINIDEGIFIKDLERLGGGRRQQDVLIVDNSLGVVRQFESLIPIVPFFGDKDDKQLIEILPYLKELSQVENAVKRNKEIFQWDVFQEVEQYNDYIKIIRKNNKLQQ